MENWEKATAQMQANMSMCQSQSVFPSGQGQAMIPTGQGQGYGMTAIGQGQSMGQGYAYNVQAMGHGQAQVQQTPVLPIPSAQQAMAIPQAQVQQTPVLAIPPAQQAMAIPQASIVAVPGGKIFIQDGGGQVRWLRRHSSGGHDDWTLMGQSKDILRSEAGNICLPVVDVFKNPHMPFPELLAPGTGQGQAILPGQGQGLPNGCANVHTLHQTISPAIPSNQQQTMALVPPPVPPLGQVSVLVAGQAPVPPLGQAPVPVPGQASVPALVPVPVLGPGTAIAKTTEPADAMTDQESERLLAEVAAMEPATKKMKVGTLSFPPVRK